MLIQYILFLCLMHFHMVKLADEERNFSSTDFRNEIYNNPDLLRAVQLSNIFEDSQEFVDKQLLDAPEIIWEKLKNSKHIFNNDEELRNFLAENFGDDNPDDNCELNDSDAYKKMWIKDDQYKDFYKNINRSWSELSFKPAEDVRKHPERHSMINVPNCYIAQSEKQSNSLPQIWQSYLMVRGLIASGMMTTASGIIRNIAHLIETKGFAPLSNRHYYSTRSQLPLFALMVDDYVEAVSNGVTNDEDYLEAVSNGVTNGEDYAEAVTNGEKFLREMLPAAEKEFQWWLDNRKIEVTKDGETYLLFRYHQSHPSNVPRPEMYRNDYTFANTSPIPPHLLPVPKDEEKQRYYYSNLYSLSETGFGLSSRFIKKILYLDVENIVPVELNSVLQKYALLIASWHISLKDSHIPSPSDKYVVISEQIFDAIENVLFDSKRGVWFDYSLSEEKSVETFSPTNLMPLFTGSLKIQANEKNDPDYGGKALEYLFSEGILDWNYELKYFILPSTTPESGYISQWDYPNGSVLLNLFLIEGLRNTEHSGAVEVARKMATMLVKTVYEGYKNTGSLLENYSAIELHTTGPSNSQKQKCMSTAGAMNVLFNSYDGTDFQSDDYEGFIAKVNVKSSILTSRGAVNSFFAGGGGKRPKITDSTSHGPNVFN